MRTQRIPADNIEALGFEHKVDDPTFLNLLQGGVNKWIKEIQRVTKLVE